MTRLQAWLSALIWIVAFTAAALALANAVKAQDFPDGFEEPRLLDRYALHQVKDWHARVEFHNVWPPNSGRAPGHLYMGAETVGISLQTGDGPEVLIVDPPEGWIAVPESIAVKDGETGWVDLYRDAPGF